MANPQEQSYTEMVKQTQVTLLTMLETWNRSFQQAFGATPVNSELIDQTFDFAEKLVHAQLNAQRQLTKQAAASGTVVAETVRAGTAQVTEALRGGSVL
jgi:hypothetical protein